MSISPGDPCHTLSALLALLAHLLCTLSDLPLCGTWRSRHSGRGVERAQQGGFPAACTPRPHGLGTPEREGGTEATRLVGDGTGI